MWRQLVRALDRPYRFLDKEKRLAAFRKSTSVLFERAQELPNLEFRASQVALYRHVEEKILQGCSIDYLEFGVWEGETVRQWTSINSSPHSRFFGFDTFEGLPEDWNAERQKGNFDLGGRPPIIDDPRVSFILGRFHESLPGFVETYKPRSRLVVHIDCDLYGSALCALT